MGAAVWLMVGGLIGGGVQDSYFPPALSEVIGPCRYGEGFPVMDEFRSAWYSAHLGAAHEPRLGDVAPRYETAGVGVLRFTWLRSFDAPVIVRVAATSGQGVSLTATELSGAGGYEPGDVARRVERRLSADEAAALAALVTESRVLELPAGNDCGITEDGAITVQADGARWIVEANGSKGYRFVDRQSGEGPVRDLGLHLLSLTGWTYDRVY